MFSCTSEIALFSNFRALYHPNTNDFSGYGGGRDDRGGYDRRDDRGGGYNRERRSAERDGDGKEFKKIYFFMFQFHRKISTKILKNK